MEGRKAINYRPTAKRDRKNDINFLMSKVLLITVDLIAATNAAFGISEKISNG